MSEATPKSSDALPTASSVPLIISAGLLVGAALGIVMGLGESPGITAAVLGVIGALLAVVGIGTPLGLRFAVGLSCGLILGLGVGLGLRFVPGPVRLLVKQDQNQDPRPGLRLQAGAADRAAELSMEAGKMLDKLDDPNDAALKAKVRDLKGFVDYYAVARNRIEALSQEVTTRPDAEALKDKIGKFLRDALPKED